MKINGKEIKHNERLTFAQTQYLEARYESLEYQINKKYDLDIYIERSRLSEAAYFYFYTDNEEVLHEFSIRNHDHVESNFCYDIWISDYRNWNELKKAIFNKIELIKTEGI